MGITVGAREAAPGALQSFWCSHTPAPVDGERGLLLSREGRAVPSDCCQSGTQRVPRRTPLCMSLLWQVSANVNPTDWRRGRGCREGQGREFRAAAV